jgi:16S rRNA (guanine527-N7)-methyltransferase
MLVTARALAPLDKLLGLAAPHLAPGGVCLFPKGRNVEEELAQARTLWRMDVEQYKTAAGEGACILKVSNIRHAGPTTTRRRDL